jgi:modification target Cys-rich repeat protein
METILNDELMVILFKVQPPKQRIPADFVVSRPIAAGCGSTCNAMCKNSCFSNCTNSCRGGCKGSCQGGCTRSCRGHSR